MTSDNFIVFYGSLMSGHWEQGLGAQQNIPVAGKIRFVQPCTVAGFLYDLGEYPGLVESKLKGKEKPLVQAELYKILDTDALRILDEYEGYYPETPEHSLYLRKKITIEEAPSDQCDNIWCYFYNENIEDNPLIESGCWRSYFQTKSTNE